ncbi:MAG TPA: hypothetical protein ENN80_10320 [Candidatus Hydrogenedentes bacterium]|nr:hypothetical protein [Candidatus Hydrogenedentota bacterium]
MSIPASASPAAQMHGVTITITDSVFMIAFSLSAERETSLPEAFLRHVSFCQILGAYANGRLHA